MRTLQEFFERDVLGWAPHSAFLPETAWPLSLGPFVALGVFLVWRSLRQVLQGSPLVRRRLMLGMALFLGGAMGLEMVANFITHESLAWLRVIKIIMEESFEMLGAITILSGLLLQVQWLQNKQQGVV